MERPSRQRDFEGRDRMQQNSPSSTEGHQESFDGETTPPATVAEWEMWYPCPVCDSTELTQTIESDLAISVTEDGSFDDESLIGEYNYVECSNCSEVLLNEIDKR